MSYNFSQMNESKLFLKWSLRCIYMTYILTQFIKWINKYPPLPLYTVVAFPEQLVLPQRTYFTPDSPFPFSPFGPGGPWGPTLPVLPTSPGEHEKDEWIILLITLHMNLHVQDFMESTRVRYYMFTSWAVILFGNSTMAFFIGQSWRLLKSWYTTGRPEQGFRCCFANGLNRQSLVSSAAQASERSERVKFLMKKEKQQTNKQTNNNNINNKKNECFKTVQSIFQFYC